MTSLETATEIGKFLQQRGWRLAVAESCTGGLLADTITDVPGSSAYFVGGLVAYAYEAKANLLGVEWSLLEAQGAVSREVVLQMAQGACRLFNVQVAVSISGIAGPGGGTPQKPVGLTWLGLCAPDYLDTRRFIWDKDRRGNKIHSMQAALNWLREILQ